MIVPTSDRKVIAARLRLPAGHEVLTVYIKRRQKLLELFPRFAKAYRACEDIKVDEDILDGFEGTLFNLVRLIAAVDDRSEVDANREFLGRLLAKFADKEFDYMWDPQLAAFAVVLSLKTEQTANARPMRALFGRSEKSDLLAALARECAARVDASRPLPGNLTERLRNLESSGVYVNADIYSAIDVANAG